VKSDKKHGVGRGDTNQGNDGVATEPSEVPREMLFCDSGQRNDGNTGFTMNTKIDSGTETEFIELLEVLRTLPHRTPEILGHRGEKNFRKYYSHQSYQLYHVRKKYLHIFVGLFTKHSQTEVTLSPSINLCWGESIDLYLTLYRSARLCTCI